MKISRPFSEHNQVVQNITLRKMDHSQVEYILKKTKKVNVNIKEMDNIFVISIYSKRNLFSSFQKKYITVKKAKDFIVKYLK